jgi:hypothetical protein
MKSTLFNASDGIEVKGKTVSGVDLIATLQHTTVNTAFAAGTVIDWNLVNITIQLKRAGLTHKIYQGPVLPVVVDSLFRDASFSQALNVGTPTQVTYQVQTAGLDHIVKQTARIKFHDVINLDGEDELTIDVQPSTAAVLATVDTSVSNIAFDVVEGIGNAPSIPCFSLNVVKANEASYTYNLGNNVVKATFVNLDKSGVAATNQVITQVALNSDKRSNTRTMDQLQLDRYTDFQSAADPDLRHQCFELVSVEDEKMTAEDVRLNKVEVSISYVAANVTASKNYVVTRSFINDKKTFEMSKARAIKHRDANVNQYL